MKIVWRSDAESNKLDSYAHIVDLDGDMMLEVLSKREGFWSRVKIGVQYIFRGSPIIYSQVLLDKDIEKIGGAFNDKQNGKGSRR